MRISDLSSDVCSSDLWNFLDSVAFSQMRELVGLDAMKVAISGAAPIAGELISWFRALGVPLSEIYGMSESTALMAWEPYRVRAGTVGRAFAGTEMLLTEEGEVCIRGGNVFLGYLDDPAKRSEEHTSERRVGKEWV